jgi:hypothetical protein
MLAIELPADLEQEVLRHSNVQQFVLKAIKRLLTEENEQALAKNESWKHDLLKVSQWDINENDIGIISWQIEQF